MMNAEQFSLEFIAGYRYTENLYRRKGITEPEDWSSAAWCRAWEKRDQWSGLSSFRTWVSGIGINLYRMALRSKVELLPLNDYVFGDKRYSADRLEDRIEAESRVLMIPADARRLFLERYSDGFSAKEVAKRHCVTEMTVKMRTVRAAKAMAAGGGR